MTTPVIIIGAGGHAKVILNVLKLLNANVIGLTDADQTLHGSEILGRPVLGDDSILSHHRPENIELVMGIGSTAPGPTRAEIYEALCSKGYRFRTCIHPAAIIADDVVIGSGTHVMAGCVIQPGCILGNNIIINTQASVDHDCQIGDHVHVAPGVILGGTVKIGLGAHIGTGATVIENISIGKGAMIAAGACVIKDVFEDERVMGIPAQNQSIQNV